MKRSLVATAAALLLASCASKPETPTDPCMAAMLLMQNPTVSPFVKQAALEKARNMGCLQ